MSTLPVVVMGTSSLSMIAQRVGTLNELSRARVPRQPFVGAARVPSASTTTAATATAPRPRRRRRARAGLRGARATRLHLARVHGRAPHLEHVVPAAGEEQVPVGVEVADVAGRVEAVLGEHLGPGTPTDAAHQVGAAQLQLAGLAVGDGRTGVEIDDAHLDAVERLPAAALLARGKRLVEPYPQ